MIVEKIRNISKKIVENSVSDLSEIFHENSKLYDTDRDFFYNIEIILKTPYLLRRMAKAYKTYPGYEIFKLEKTKGNDLMRLLINHRRSQRNYLKKGITIKKLSNLLQYGLGVMCSIKGLNEINLDLRAYPSAGALYPIESYIAVFDVNELKKGIYHYNVKDHSLELLKIGDCKNQLGKICLAEEIIKNANIVLIFSSVFKRTTIKYGIRGYRFSLIEAGIVGQNVTLVAESLGLGSCMLGGFYDDEVNKLLDVDGVNEAVVNIMTVGIKSDE